MESPEAARGRLADALRLLYMRGLVQVKGGNASIVDRDRGLIYITPSGTPKHTVKPEDIAVVDLDGNTISGYPSSEHLLHSHIYKAIREAKAIVHAHPPHVLALVEAGINIDTSLLAEAHHKIKCLAKIPPIKPGTLELAESTARKMRETGCNIAILERHGVVAYSASDIYDALDTIEALEDLAKIIIAKTILGKLASNTGSL